MNETIKIESGADFNTGRLTVEIRVERDHKIYGARLFKNELSLRKLIETLTELEKIIK